MKSRRNSATELFVKQASMDEAPAKTQDDERLKKHSLEVKEIELPPHFQNTLLPWDIRRATIMGASPRLVLKSKHAHKHLERQELELPAHFQNGLTAWDMRRATLMGASPRLGSKSPRAEKRRLEMRRGTLLGAVIKFEADQVIHTTHDVILLVKTCLYHSFSSRKYLVRKIHFPPVM